MRFGDVAQFKEERKKSNSAVTLQDISDRRRWLIYDQDLEIYYLGIAKDDLREATTELAALKATWLKAQSRESKSLQEIEIEDLQLQGGSLHG